MTSRSLTALLAAVAVAGGCSAKENAQNASTDSTAAATTAAAPASAAPNVVTFTAKDFAFQGPAEVPAGLVTFRLVNQGQQLHHAQIIKLAQGKTAQDLVAALKAGGPPPAWMTEVGGPNAPAPGGDSNFTTVLEPGDYAVLCFVDIPDHVPHFMKGMAQNLKVTPATGPVAAEPQASTTISLSDYKFDVSQPLKAGQQTIRVENHAAQDHEVELVQLAPGKTAKDVAAWVANPQGPPPGKPLGGIAGLAPNSHGEFTATLEPGNYAFLCFLPDAKDGKMHVEHGMMQDFKVS